MRSRAPLEWAAASSAVAHTFVTTLDDALRVAGADGHHLQRVRRLERGELVTAADGNGAWREYVVIEAASGTIALEAVGAVRAEPRLQPRLAVAFALTKGEQPEAVVRGLTELGVDRVLPVVSSRSQVRWRGERARTQHDRLQRVAREAGAQCRRARLPEITPVGEVSALAGHAGLLLADRSGPPAACVPEPPDGEWLVVIGPEGGLTRQEAAALGGYRLGLGPHVLRAGTAAVGAAAALASRRSPRGYKDGHGQ